jgi:hypothetical protein
MFKNLLNALNREYCGMQQDRNIHEEPAMPNVVKVILKVLVNEKSPVRTQLPKPRDTRYNAQPLSLSNTILSNNERHLRTGAH